MLGFEVNTQTHPFLYLTERWHKLHADVLAVWPSSKPSAAAHEMGSLAGKWTRASKEIKSREILVLKLLMISCSEKKANADIVFFWGNWSSKGFDSPVEG